MIGDLVSWVAGLSLMVAGLLVMWAYRPQQWPSGGAGWLQAAIFMGFAAAVGNTAFWQVIGQPAVSSGLVEVGALRAVGDWLDLVFKGGAAFAGWMHLKALHLSLNEEERDDWGVLEIAFYPQRRLCLKALYSIVGRKS